MDLSEVATELFRSQIRATVANNDELDHLRIVYLARRSGTTNVRTSTSTTSACLRAGCIIGCPLPSASTPLHAAQAVACDSVPSHAVPVALVGACSRSRIASLATLSLYRVSCRS